MEVQIFGVKKNADVRKAERFFKERRVRVHFMDFKQRNPSKGEEISRFGSSDGLLYRRPLARNFLRRTYDFAPASSANWKPTLGRFC